MIGYVTLGTNNLDAATKFYDALFATIGAGRILEDDSFVAWATGPTAPAVSVTRPFDDNAATVGTANFDNRSFRLNFEITALVIDAEFGGKVEKMFEKDFASSRLMQPDEYDNKPFWFKLAVRTARLTAPVL